jgi:hypothetical protein
MRETTVQSHSINALPHKSFPVKNYSVFDGQLSALLAHLSASDPELAHAVAAWRTLSNPIRAAMLALVLTPDTERPGEARPR